MKAVILAGGRGSRMGEESLLRPKPMIEIGGMPILWHIMKIYSAHGINDFVICLGYKGYLIKEYFANYALHMSDVTFDLRANSLVVHQNAVEPWSVTLIDTGDETMTGSRVKRAIPHVGDSDFCLTYGDGVADVDVTRVIEFHRSQGTLATVTAVQLPGRFGALHVEDDLVDLFHEKPRGDGGWVNGGFFVLSTRVGDYIEDTEHTIWEQEPLQRLSSDRQLSAYKHEGFWHPMDTLWDRIYLQELWEAGDAPWKKWT